MAAWILPIQQHAQAQASSPDTSNSPVQPRSVIDQLAPEQIQNLLSGLKSDYVDPHALGSEKLDQATLRDLVAHLGPGLLLAPTVPRAVIHRPFRSDLLSNRFGYVRLGNLDDAMLAKLDVSLLDLKTRSIAGLIIDLRTVPETTDYGIANQVLARFVKPRVELYRLVDRNDVSQPIFAPDQRPAYTGPTVALVSRQNSGAAEVIAAVLRTQAKAIIVGENTRGGAVEYTQVPINSETLLLIASRQVRVAHTPPIFPGGLSPDILVTPDPKINQILAETDRQSIIPFLGDTARRHLSEASLVTESNPELDVYEAEKNGATPETKPRDQVAQRAIDFLTAVTVFDKH